MSRRMLITKELEITVQRAYAEARKRRHEYVTLEHLLYALLEDPLAAKILEACGVDFEELRGALDGLFNEMLSLPKECDPDQATSFWRPLQRALYQAEASGKGPVDAGRVLLFLFQEQNSHAVYVLQSQNVSRLDVMSYLTHGITRHGYERILKGDESHADDDAARSTQLVPVRVTHATEDAPDVLAAFAVNLNARAAEGRIDPLIGRTKELRRTVQVLCRRRKNNPLLVGDPGVGKTAIAEGLALAIHEGRVPDELRGAVVYALDLGALVAGTKYRGEFEERLKDVVEKLASRPLAILFIDEIHTLVGAGATSGAMDGANLLKPALAAGALRCLGSTTYAEYRAVIERDGALARRFQAIEIAEPSLEETICILQGLRPHYERHHGLRFTDEAIEAAAILAEKYLSDRKLPDKAIDLLDEAAAAEKLLPADERAARIDVDRIESVVAETARIPTVSVSADDGALLGSLEQRLRSVIFGQDDAIAAITGAIKLNRSGLGSAGKPIGSFLFSGPTGVGKTELAKQLAGCLGVEFARFDMSEYAEPHAISRLVGAPPGYIGHDRGGLLTDTVRRRPYSVLLLDELEKAHPDIFNVLLQVMDHATLTDASGTKADFRHTIVVMTTNAGAREIHARSLGFTAGQGTTQKPDGRQAIERTFTPEFRNRLDAWISFAPLEFDVIMQVVGKFLDELRAQLAERNVDLEVTPSARRWLTESGFDPEYGARPMHRLIQDQIRKPLADELLFGRLRHGGRVKVGVRAGKLEAKVA